MEMIKRLYIKLRPQALYARSLSVLKNLKRTSESFIKSGFMVGLGETQEEVKVLINDLASVGCDILTIGQYLSPGIFRRNVPVERFVSLEEFEYYKEFAVDAGIKTVLSGPLVRSSFLAEKIFQERQNDHSKRIEYAFK
jgi:lipoic acid synthetase